MLDINMYILVSFANFLHSLKLALGIDALQSGDIGSMPDFKTRRRMARMLDRAAQEAADLDSPPDGWIAAMRAALTMPAEVVANRKGVTRSAIYQAERSEKDGAISLKQMDRIAKAMGGRFVYAIVPEAPIDTMRYKQALHKARDLARDEPGFEALSAEHKQDWIEDTAAELLHDTPTLIWDRNP